MTDLSKYAGERRELAVRGTHDRVLSVVKDYAGGGRVLDVGAGRGALSQKLLAAGYDVSACDLFPELFDVEGMECRRVDANGALPFEDASFDLVLAVEVVEHIENHSTLFAEAARLLRPGGSFLFTTPNISSFKSRMRFLFSGYFYSFGPLDPDVVDPVSQHISPFTVDRYQWMLARAGLRIDALRTDKRGSTSLLCAPLYPIVRLVARWKHGGSEGVRRQNSPAALFGRTLFVVAKREP